MLMITIAETQDYYNKITKLFNDNEQEDIINYLSNNPKAGDLIQGTGGIRKLRWKHNNKGKSGGVRIIYYYYNERMPLYMLTVFGKGEKTNLSQSERNELAKLTKVLENYWLGDTK